MCLEFGRVLFRSSGDITLADPTNNFVGTVTASGGNLSLADANALTAVITAGGSATLNAGTTLNVSGSTSTTLNTTSGSDTNFGATTVGTDLTAGSGGVITQSGTLLVNGTAGLTASRAEERRVRTEK